MATAATRTDEDAYADDPRPWACDPPIVHIERPWDDDDRMNVEERVVTFVAEFGGRFWGT
jgi:hypothetical protein